MDLLIGNIKFACFSVKVLQKVLPIIHEKELVSVGALAQLTRMREIEVVHAIRMQLQDANVRSDHFCELHTT